MNPDLRDLLDLVARWIHLIAGIMWIGNSMLFNWLDRNLYRAKDDERHVGTMWMVHSGGFYEVEKKYLGPGEMPDVLHWFKWQSYTTWLTGAALLVLVYYMGAGSNMIDPEVYPLTEWQATGVGVGSIVLGFAIYDGIWRSPLKNVEGVAIALSLAFVCAWIYGLTHLLSGRAAFLHVGATLGTIMSGNVFFHIMPSQAEMIRATKAGREQDRRLGEAAKQRSIHNNYITFPVLFIMLSNHFPSTFGADMNWAVLGVLIVGGALSRHWMNVRWSVKPWLQLLFGTIGVTLLSVYALTVWMRPAPVAKSGESVGYATVGAVIQSRCLPCHSEAPSDPTLKAPPNGIKFDTPEQVKMMSERIMARAVVQKTMPQNNKTHMTQEERDLLATWIAQGANIQ